LVSPVYFQFDHPYPSPSHFVVETPQLNARVERKHQHILNVARALLFQSHLPKQFWCYAVNHAVFLINRVSTPLLGHKTPYQLLYDSLPDIKLFKVFCSLCYASTIMSHRSKHDPRARKCCFLCYKSGFKGSVLFDLHSREIFISRNVIFHDHILPYPSSSKKNLEYFPSSSPQSSDSSIVTTVRHIIALASIHHWFIHQLYVNNAFLHGELQDNVYMQLPPGVKSSKPN